MPSNGLKKLLIDQIAQSGPITVERYFQEAMWHPQHGYYATGKPIGAGGDFITAPEVSQMFGELIGLWVATCWDVMGRPADVNLVELGPGRGTMMKDVQRAIGAVCLMRPNVHLVEKSPALRGDQSKQISDASPTAWPVTWHETLGDVPSGPMILLANEFFDALPIRQIVKTESGWIEAMIGLSQDGSSLEPHAGPPAEDLAEALPESLADTESGRVAELSPARTALTAEIAARLAEAPGCALIIDYGPAQSALGETLQALGPEGFASVFEAPGTVDLSAHVDFAALERAAGAAGAIVHGPITQATFLERLGIAGRADNLKKNASETQRAEIDMALTRLTAPAQMGNLFKALALSSQDILALPGFDP